MAEFERIEKVSYLQIFTHNINKRKFMISCCDCKYGLPAFLFYLRLYLNKSEHKQP